LVSQDDASLLLRYKLQMRTQVLDERLEDTFRDWYPDFRKKTPDDEIKQAV
jgi:hypothetical protein